MGIDDIPNPHASAMQRIEALKRAIVGAMSEVPGATESDIAVALANMTLATFKAMLEPVPDGLPFNLAVMIRMFIDEFVNQLRTLLEDNPIVEPPIDDEPVNVTLKH